MSAKQMYYEGHVQGVGFRYTTKQLAMGYDLIGWVRNLADGRVELQVMGDTDELDDFLEELEENSVLAGNIRDIERHDIAPLDGVNGFSIR